MTSLPDRIGQLFRLMLSSDKPGEIVAAAAALNRTLAVIDHDLHSAADAFVAALFHPAEVPMQAPPREAPQEDDDGEWVRVDYLELFHHQKAGGGPPTCRALYHTALGNVSDWWAFEHRGAAREIAIARWRALGGLYPPPRDVDEAVDRQDELSTGIEIQIDTSGRYPQVTAQRVRQEVYGAA
jgi:hypothetical protein